MYGQPIIKIKVAFINAAFVENIKYVMWGSHSDEYEV
jgi:hypothetical protein